MAEIEKKNGVLANLCARMREGCRARRRCGLEARIAYYQAKVDFWMEAKAPEGGLVIGMLPSVAEWKGKIAALKVKLARWT